MTTVWFKEGISNFAMFFYLVQPQWAAWWDVGALFAPGAPISWTIVVMEMQELHATVTTAVWYTVCLLTLSYYHAVSNNREHKTNKAWAFQHPYNKSSWQCFAQVHIEYKQIQATVSVWHYPCALCLGLVGPELRGLCPVQSFSPFRVQSGWARYRSRSSSTESSHCTRVSGARDMCALISKGANFPQAEAKVWNTQQYCIYKK